MFVYFGDREFEFQEYSNGLYYYDSDGKNKIKNGLSSLQTVEELAKKYSKNHVRSAQEVTELQQYLFWPGTRRLMSYLNGNQL